jgi:uncharacterized protein
MQFINRIEEINILNEKYSEQKSHFFILYGKRRVGKTELIKQFIKKKPAVYYLADKRNISEQTEDLGKMIGSHFKDPVLEKRGFENWLELFDYLKQKVKNRFVLVIDEYPYLVESEKSTGSIFQKGWDEYLKDTKIFLILSGSSIAMMESEALIYKSPLYGRRTGQILLKPMSFEDSWNFFSKKKFENYLEIYAITGGMPAYLNQFNPDYNIEDNIKNFILKKTEFLHNEIEFVLKEELREPKNYLSILRSLSLGKTKYGEIINDTGMEKNVLHKYLMTLERLQIIEKEIPVTEINQLKSRKGIYTISDNFFHFWFRFIYPFRSYLEVGNYREFFRKMYDSFNILTAYTYEKIAKEILSKYQDRIFAFEKIGRWWDKSAEIDVIALNSSSKEIIFGEVKWSNKPVGTDILEKLKEKSMNVQWFIDERKAYYVLFSKSGFTKDMMLLAKQENIFLINKDKIYEP